MPRRAILCLSLLLTSSAAWYLTAEEPAPPDRRAAAKKEFDNGNFKDAYDLYRVLTLGRDTEPDKVGDDLSFAVQCLQRLNRNEESDALREEFVAVHTQNPRALAAAARSLMSDQHYGFLVSGEFHRGSRRGGGDWVGSEERDRVVGLRWLTAARRQLLEANSPQLLEETDRVMIQYLQWSRYGGDAWKLQILTDLEGELPDYQQYQYRGRGRGYVLGSSSGAPVNADGTPVFHRRPENYEASASDGERWRALMAEIVLHNPGAKWSLQFSFAQFLHQQFGVQTMGGFSLPRSQDGKEDESGPFAVHTLKDNETIARLATGIKRFELPDEFNFLKLFRELADVKESGHDAQALETLAQIHSNRRQYPRAAEYWKEVIARHGPGNNNYRREQLNQIVGNWGRFENVGVFPAGQAPEIPFRFRNAKKVAFTAQRIDVPKLIEDTRDYIKKASQGSSQLDWQYLNVHDIGNRLIQEDQSKYVKEEVAKWELALEPRDAHRDQQLQIATPLQAAGAYLLTAKIDDGNVTRIIVWVSDLAIVKKTVDGADMIYVADAVTGTPIEQVNVEFFGYRQEYQQPQKYVIKVSQFAEFTNANGMIAAPARAVDLHYQWLFIARKGERFAFLGYEGLSRARSSVENYKLDKIYVVTDRPVYRPGHTVKFNVWARAASYATLDPQPFLKETFNLTIYTPQGEKLLEKQVTTDEYGGYADEIVLGEDAQLGQYNLVLDKPNIVSGSGYFRVEEYKKPEYEVTIDAPDKPVKLGDAITATIRAKYYFGAPVTHAKVHYKVTRQSHDSRWYPGRPWDWFYEPGYWWFGNDYGWYPGWGRWGCLAPYRSWWPQRHDPPEVVSEGDAEIGPDGTLKVDIDTAPALAAHGDQDHKYEITAEVVDQSRRTIVGTGSVLVARQPFKVFVWPDRGYYTVGDTAEFRFKAQTLDQKPVAGKGRARLLKVTYDENAEPSEAEVQAWDVDTDAQGEASLKIKTSQAGQYRLSYAVTGAEGNEIEGAYVFLVRGEGFDGSQFRFNELELVTEKQEYQPGETIKLLINTNRAGATVLLFPRSANGVASKPQVLRMAGKSEVVEIAVTQSDMPNFFIEALTVFDGKLHSQTREVIVPPAKKIINVAVEPSSTEYQPGAASKLTLKFTDESGEPFTGSTLLAVYDKSVEYISGGSNVADIREFFWKWRRSYYASHSTSLSRYFYALYKQNENAMQNLGVFGDMLDQLVEKDGVLRKSELQRGENRRALGFAGDAMPAAPESAAAPGMAMAKNAMEDDRAADKSSTGEGPPNVEPAVRKNFADTAYWSASIKPNAEGIAEVEFPLPESLTTWKIRTWIMGAAAEVGEGTSEVVTKKNVIVRLQAPRFFTEKDEVVLSANVHNYLAEEKSCTVKLTLTGEHLKPLDASTERVVTIPANGEVRVDWIVKAVNEGIAVVKAEALTDQESDALEMSFPVFVHGMLKTESYTGVIRQNADSAKVSLDVPAERRINQSRLEIRYSPTLAGAMVDALPYLVEYPYGCTEQTLNRFLPTVITQNILKRMNLDLKAIQEKRTNLNAQEIGDDRQRAAGWKRFDINPVFDEAEVAKMVKEGVQKLTEMQLSDGGWGWFSGFGERSWPHTTAVVVHGLQIAQQNGVALVPGVLENGVAWLKRYQDEQVELIRIGGLDPEQRKNMRYKLKADNLDALVFMILVDAGITDDRMDAYLYRDRIELALYAKAIYGLALHKLNDAEKLNMILRNIDQFLVQDEENETAYLQDQASPWWYWYGSDIEANAFYLKLLAKTDPQGVRASRLVKYLLNNRKHATYWNSTRDTAYAIEALAEYLVASGESEPDMTIEVWLNGKKQKEVKVTAENLFSFDNKFELVGDAVETGRHTLELRRTGKGPVYFNAYLTNFTLEDFIEKAGLEVKVTRKYYKLIRDDREGQVAGSRGEVVGQREERYRREEIPNLGELTSGDLVEIELSIDSKNDYEYLLFEDMKAAGFEPVDLRSGYVGGSLGAYMELRDEKVTLFVRRLLRGEHSLSYRLRAEIPGRFSALPTRAAAMYAPELRANSDEIKLRIVDAGGE